MPEPTKKLLAMVRPPKQWSEMTEEEMRAFAREIVGLARERANRPPPPEPPKPT